MNLSFGETVWMKVAPILVDDFYIDLIKLKVAWLKEKRLLKSRSRQSLMVIKSWGSCKILHEEESTCFVGLHLFHSSIINARGKKWYQVIEVSNKAWSFTHRWTSKSWWKWRSQPRNVCNCSPKRICVLVSLSFLEGLDSALFFGMRSSTILMTQQKMNSFPLFTIVLSTRDILHEFEYCFEQFQTHLIIVTLMLLRSWSLRLYFKSTWHSFIGVTKLVVGPKKMGDSCRWNQGAIV